MGQCYNVALKIKVNDEQGAIRALKQKIDRAQEDNVEYNVDYFRENEGVDVDTLDGLVRIFLAGYETIPYHRFEKDVERGFTCYRSAFDACYGWETVMIDFFNVLAPFCTNLSWIKIWPDSGLDYGIVRRGRLIWKS